MSGGRKTVLVGVKTMRYGAKKYFLGIFRFFFRVSTKFYPVRSLKYFLFLNSFYDLLDQSSFLRSWESLELLEDTEGSLKSTKKSLDTKRIKEVKRSNTPKPKKTFKTPNQKAAVKNISIKSRKLKENKSQEIKENETQNLNLFDNFERNIKI